MAMRAAGLKLIIGAAVLLALVSCAQAVPTVHQELSGLDLRGVSVDFSAESEQLSFSFEARQAKKNETPVDLTKQAQKNLDYFFIGLAVPAEKFWVNLSPAGADRIMDPLLKDTGLGRVILAADLMLKKDVAAMTNPRTSIVGKQYWEKVYAKAEELGIQEQIPLVTRVWIVPDEAEVYETEGEVQIIQSPLRVCLETEYFRQQQEIADVRQRELIEYAAGLMRSTILPAVTRKVNDSPAYAQLRGVFRALLLAEWYKEKFISQPRSILRYAAATALKESETDAQDQPEQIYREYLRSLKNGEYNFSESENGRLDFYLNVITRDYFSGGVDFRTRDRHAAGKRPAPTDGAIVFSSAILLKKHAASLASAKRALESNIGERRAAASAALKQLVGMLDTLSGIHSVHPAGADRRLTRATEGQL